MVELPADSAGYYPVPPHWYDPHGDQCLNLGDPAPYPDRGGGRTFPEPSHADTTAGDLAGIGDLSHQRHPPSATGVTATDLAETDLCGSYPSLDLFWETALEDPAGTVSPDSTGPDLDDRHDGTDHLIRERSY